VHRQPLRKIADCRFGPVVSFGFVLRKVWIQKGGQRSFHKPLQSLSLQMFEEKRDFVWFFRYLFTETFSKHDLRLFGISIPS
jgi:hypothetical protein